ncbi:hypothetical protein SAMN05421505_11868 [Sinosporangium album]|uniref:Uncharacterized protein n=1 Tax=Sinosporangium album TaxID=504805 RepID=A0A1G8DJJ8_9ACTN|nr:hypothetical protein [Sinosporangium album]SDH57580.1 hypothetical protein SAMN05421505_11868 [Sinosporangium album]
MTLLEQRYRRILRLLPAAYRSEREDEMVAAFLDGAHSTHDRDNPRPRPREIASVAALAVRLRLGTDTTRPRAHTWGRAVRTAALIGLGFHAATELRTTAAVLLAPDPAGETPWLPHLLPGPLFAAAFALLCLGRIRAAKAAALIGLVPYGVWALQHASALVRALTAPGDLPGVNLPLDLAPLLTQTAGFALVAALVAAYHRDADPPRTPHWVAAVPLAAAAALTAADRALTRALTQGLPDGGPVPDAVHWAALWTDTPGLACTAIAAAAAAHLLTRLRTPHPDAARPLTLALLSLAALPLAAVRIDPHAADTLGQAMTLTAAAQTAALALCAAAMLTAGLRSLPAAPPHARPLPAA